VYARNFDNRPEPLTFGVSGKLIRNALVMYDRQTDTLWSQFLGVAVAGELQGTRLEPLASTLTDWGTWRRLYPDTIVLDQGGQRFDPYSSYYVNGSAGVLGERNSDDRLGLKEFVLGIQLPGFQEAYAFRDLSDMPVVNDRLGDQDLLVVFDRDAATGVAFDRLVDGRVLTFDLAPDAPGAPEGLLAIRDRETGTLWSGLTGEATEGALAGAQLQQLTFTQVFWFAWTDFFPDAPLWGRDG
jgi:hypothetical protein